MSENQQKRGIEAKSKKEKVKQFQNIKEEKEEKVITESWQSCEQPNIL